MDPNRANEVRKKCSCPKRSVYGQLWGQRLLSVDPWFRPIPMCVFEKSCGPRLSSLGGGMDPTHPGAECLSHVRGMFLSACFCLQKHYNTNMKNMRRALYLQEMSPL